MSIYDIIQELNAENGSNYKMDVLRKHSDNTLLQRVLKMTYDRVDFTYGISMKNITVPESAENQTLEWAVLSLLDLANRKYTGHEARDYLEAIFRCINTENQEVVKGIINRDLRINMGRSNINKVFKDLIVKPVYMRCGLFNEKTKTKINPKAAFVQLKADGTYREFTVEHGKVSAISRSGESYEYPVLDEVLETYPDGHYIGELTVWRDGAPLGRAEGNGLINSDNPPHADIVLEAWDYVTLEEYTAAANKVKGTTPYHKRFARLEEIVAGPPVGNVRVIETYRVETIAEALGRCNDWMTAGYEGAILKDANAIFRDGTSPQQLKLKLEIDADVRITGFKPGRVGTKREGKIGSIEFATDDGQVKGYCSGFTDAELDDMDARREELLGQIIAVTFNDITQARGNDYHALSHPRFVEIRTDKTETDTLERIFESKEMAMAIGG